MVLRRVIYLGYYLKTLDRETFSKFLRHASAITGRSKAALLSEVVACSLEYNVSLLEYFHFRFHELDREARATYAGMGFMYEYQLAMNPRSERGILDNKLWFYSSYRPLIRRTVASLEALASDASVRASLIKNAAGKIVLKFSRGKCGRQVQVLDCGRLDGTNLPRYMSQHGFDLAEEFVMQHHDLMALSPSGVNTVRIITQLNTANEVDILGVRLRVTVNSAVDNMAAGNLAATVDPATGVVDGPGVYSDITRDDVLWHPVTGVPIKGFRIPFWAETLALAKRAAAMHPGNRSVGWDIAIREDGPELIEGNHDWCKLLWQLPAKRGMKGTLAAYLAEFKAGARRARA